MIAKVVPWLITIAALVCCGLLVRRAWNQEASAKQAEEQTRLDAEGQITAHAKTVKELEADKQALTVGNQALELTLAAALKAAPGAKVERTVKASTGPMVVGGAPRECPAVDPAVQPQCPVCLVAPGDSLEVRVSEVDLQTKAGNRVVVGTGECLRLNPDTSLARGAFEASLTTVATVSPVPDTRWPWYVHEAIGAGAGLVAGVMLTR